METNNLPQLDKRKSIVTLIDAKEHESIKQSVSTLLEQGRFNFVVTNDNVSEAKKVMAELNAITKDMKEFQKYLVERESKDIDAFKGNFKEYQEMVGKQREKIENDVKVFTEKAKADHKKALEYHLGIAYDTSGIRPEFKDFTLLNDMLTTTPFANQDGSLKKKWLDAIDAIIETAKGKQAQADLAKAEEEKRIAEEVALQVEEQRLKDAEHERERLAKEKEQALKEQKQELEQNNNTARSIDVPENVPDVSQRTEPFVPAQNNEPVRTHTPPPVAKQGNSVYAVQINYKIEAKTGIPCPMIINKIRGMMQQAGFQSDLDIDVVEVV